MKGLSSVPSLRDLERAYRKLQSDLESISIAEWALWSQWSRFDPRLAEQWISGLSKQWRDVSPLLLNESLRSHPWPAAAGVLLEQAWVYWDGSQEEKTLFRAWSRCVMSGVEAAPNELFFIGLRAFAGEAARRDAIESLKPYRKWGYYGRELLVNKALARKKRTLASPGVRRRKLEELLKSRSRITVGDYIDCLGGAVGRRQAELDLQKTPRLKPIGQTQGRFYRAVGKSRLVPSRSKG